MLYATLADFQVGIKFDRHDHTAVHTFKSGNKEQRTTRSYFAKLYRVDGDRQVPLKTGYHSTELWRGRSKSSDALRKKALLAALQAAGIPRAERVKVWQAYAKAHRTSIPAVITPIITRKAAA